MWLSSSPADRQLTVVFLSHVNMEEGKVAEQHSRYRVSKSSSVESKTDPEILTVNDAGKWKVIKAFMQILTDSCLCVLSSMGQDEDMDTTALAQPCFMIEKEKGMESGDEEKLDGDDSDDGQGDDPNGPVKEKEEAEEEEEDDDEVSASKKASTNERLVENGGSTKTNGNHHSGSEESSDEEDLEEDQTTVKVMKCLPISSVLQSQTSAS